MIIFENTPDTEPYNLFRSYYDQAFSHKQSHICAAAISSYNNNSNEVNSRFVNIKYINREKFIFFSNYYSVKAEEFNMLNNISILFFWPKIDMQIRIKAKIEKISSKQSNKHFNSRSPEKNALSIVSDQSNEISSYQNFLDKYQEFVKNNNIYNLTRPEYWGGYSCIPFEFEFWSGNKNRLNKRINYKFLNSHWEKKCLQP